MDGNGTILSLFMLERNFSNIAVKSVYKTKLYNISPSLINAKKNLERSEIIAVFPSYSSIYQSIYSLFIVSANTQ